MKEECSVREGEKKRNRAVDEELKKTDREFERGRERESGAVSARKRKRGIDLDHKRE